ncbi:hypothetical protein [Maribacter sp. ACAM166]|nr:hypothetical protein [Maribacter sp. ACAM166]
MIKPFFSLIDEVNNYESKKRYFTEDERELIKKELRLKISKKLKGLLE